MFPVWDMIIYLVCMQFILLWNLHLPVVDNIDKPKDTQKVFFFFSIAASLFWLVWGGFSVDAWRYLSRFDFSPLHFREEQLFWITGYLLNKIVPDPWPIKILSALSIVILIWSYFRYFGKTQRRELVIAYVLLLATPGYFLLIGNTVRQGMAGCIEILGATFFLQRKYLVWLLLTIAGYLVHQFGILVAAALLIAKLLQKHLLWVWVASFLVSPFSTYIFSLFGYNLEDMLRYGDYTEGLFHWEKTLVSLAISIFILSSFRYQQTTKIDFRHVYIALSIVSNTVLLYEVPYERLFLFSDLIAPVALGQILAKVKWIETNKLAFTFLVLLFSTVLWTNYSIVKSLGYL